MVIYNAAALNNEELLKEFQILKVLEASTYYDVCQPEFAYKSEEAKKEDINYLHAVRHEISRVRNILLKRGFRNV